MPASSSNGVFRYLLETTTGEIETGNPQVYRVTGGTLAQTTTSTEDNELRSDRGRGDSVLVSGSVGGPLNINLSHKTHNDFLSALLADEPTPASTNGIKTISDMAFNATTHTISSATTLLPVLEKGQWFQILGATDAGNNGIYRASLTTAPTSGAIVVEVAVKDVAVTATAHSCTISSTRFKQGNDAPKTYTIERELSDVGKFFTWAGCHVSSLNLSFSPTEKVTGTFNFLGQVSEVHGDASLFPGIASAVAAPTTPQFNSVTGCHVLLDSTDLGSSCAASFSIDINANLRERRCLSGGLAASSIGYDQFSVSGTLSIFFGSASSSTFYNKNLSDLPFTFAIACTDSAGNAFCLNVYRAKITSCSVDGGSLGSDCMMSVTFSASTDSTITNSLIAIDVVGSTA